MSDSPANRRVRVTSPRTGGWRPRTLTGTEEIDAQTEIGEVYMRSLIRSQLRAAITVLLALVVGIGGLPLVFWMFPATATFTVFGLPVPWLLLGIGVYPAMGLAGWLYVRQAERNERAFAELVERR